VVFVSCWLPIGFAEEAVTAPSGDEVAVPEKASAEDSEYKYVESMWAKNVQVKLGAGIRASARSTEDGAPNGDSNSKEFNLDHARLYVNGKVLDYLGFELNGEVDTAGSSSQQLEVLDAVFKIEPNPLFNVWAGRFLPPSDRSNLSGPFFLNGAYDFPMVQAYPNIFHGRDNGVATWGQIDGGMFKWQAGIFEGTDGAINQKDNPLFAGRLVLNLLDPEPGYYNFSTYYGAKDVLAIGVSGMHQENSSGTLNAGGTPSETGDFTGFNVDVLFEKKLSSLDDGVVSLEGAYYVYDDDDLDEAALPEDGSLSLVGDPNRQGESFFVLGSFLFPTKIGVGIVQGQLQPYVRFQKYDRSSNAGLEKVTETGVNYIVDGHNARVSLFYQNLDVASGPAVDSFVLAGQFQF
jgi:hypothetical protein